MTGRNLGRLAALTLAVLAAALGLAACGSSSGGGSDEDQIRTVVNHLADSDKAVCGELTDAYLKKIFKDKDRCEKQAEGSNEKDAFQITSVKVSGDKAAAAVTTKKKEKGTISLVKEGGDWKIDNIQESSASNTKTQTSSNADEVKARAAVDAFLKGVNDEDEQVVCGLLSEGYAKRILHRPGTKFAIAACVTAFKNFDWSNLKKQAKGVQSKNVAVFGDAASVTLSDGEIVNLKRQSSRFVIDNIHR